MIRVFLDANILFSASWRETNRFKDLWSLKVVQLVTSTYAYGEVERNILSKKPIAYAVLQSLMESVEISNSTSVIITKSGLPEKDEPILASAIGSNCAVLLTGDLTHFGHLIGQQVEGTTIMTINMFMKSQA